MPYSNDTVLRKDYITLQARRFSERGMKVILPVDGISAEALYPEQYTVWHLANAPRVSAEVTITRTDMIKF
jgi:hypothetical protein